MIVISYFIFEFENVGIQKKNLEMVTNIENKTIESFFVHIIIVMR